MPHRDPSIDARHHAASSDVPDRRRFLCVLGAGGCATALAPLLGCEVAELKQTGGGSDSFDFDVATLTGLATVGGMAKADAGLRKLLLVRSGDDTVSAISRVCSHQDLEMNPPELASYDDKAKTVQCGWHGSKFGLDGKVVAGPATAAIASFPVTFDKATGKGTVDLAGVA